MKIIIPSYKRPNEQITLSRLPINITKQIYLLIREEGYAKYKKHEDQVKRIIFTPSYVKNYGQTVHYILKKYAGEKIIILDDDVTFYIRKSINPNNWHLRYMENEEYQPMFDMIETCLNDYTHVGISAREGNNRRKFHFENNTRYMRVLAYNLEMFEGVDIERYLNMETFVDFDINLQLLKLGMPSIVSFYYAQGHVSSNARGGCSATRTLEKHGQCAKMLKDYHPDFVKLVEKQTKTAWRGHPRTDVVISWKRAFESAKQKGSNYELF